LENEMAREFSNLLSFFVCFPREVGVRDELESELSRLLQNSKLSGFESREISKAGVLMFFFIFLSKLPPIDRQLLSKPKQDFQARKRPKKPKSK
jgi:hypothetical protein